MGHCDGFCTANMYRLAPLREHLDERGYTTSYFRETLHARGRDRDAFLFPYGVVVVFGETSEDNATFLEEIRWFEEGVLYEPVTDEFTFSLHGRRIIHDDHIQLPGQNDELLEKLAVAHGIAQSLKLAWFEIEVQKTIEGGRHIPENLAGTGSARLSRRELARIRGRLFLVKSQVILQFDLLDTPEFFWEHPELDPLYSATHGYLEVQQRIEVLNRKLEVIHELFEMLADEQKHDHSSRLEWIIIWLIAVEILVFILHDVLNFF